MDNKQIGTEEIKWDLGAIYSGLDDPQIDLDIIEITEKSKKFSDSYRGKLADSLGRAIGDYSEIIMLRSKVELYLFLKQSINVTDSIVKAKIADTERILSRSEGEYLTFFTLEIIALEDKALEKLYSEDSIVAKHRPWIEHLRVFKPNILSEPVEAALIKRSPFGSSAWSEFFNELQADLEFDFMGSKKSLTEMLHILTESKNSGERFEAMSLINSNLKQQFAKYSAQTLYMVTGSGNVEGRERTYSHPMEARNKSNRISDSVVDALHTAVNNIAGPLARRYYKLKASHLGLETLKWSDRNAPMPFADTSAIPFNDAIKTVLAAYESFSPTLAEIIRGFIKEKRIDAPVSKGRRDGAYNYSVVLPGNVPVSFTFLNYLGSGRDVMTLAHELGHGVHGILAGEEQGALMSNAPIAYCETASVFGEMTTFNFLKKKMMASGDSKSTLAIIMGKIDDILNTAVRQIGFSNFERRIHGIDPSFSKWQEPKKLSVEELNSIWVETLKPLYGEEGEVFTYENAEHLWAYIPHFHRSFYVYGYAFGELLTQSLYARQSDFGDKFEQLYLDMLKSGGTKNVVDLLKPFGLDPADDKFWADGINSGLGAMVEEAEKLTNNIQS